MNDYRMYEQALKTLEKNKVKPYDTINPFNETVDSSGICPTITTRPEGFKTAILIVDDKVPTILPSGCVDCDSCDYRSEVSVCELSSDNEDCPLLVCDGKDSKL